MSPVPGCAQRIAKFLLSRLSLTARFGYLPRSGVKWTLCAAQSRVRGGVARCSVEHRWSPLATGHVHLCGDDASFVDSIHQCRFCFSWCFRRGLRRPRNVSGESRSFQPELRNFCPFRPDNWAADLVSPPEWPQLDQEPSRARHADSTLTCLTSCCCIR